MRQGLVDSCRTHACQIAFHVLRVQRVSACHRGSPVLDAKGALVSANVPRRLPVNTWVDNNLFGLPLYFIFPRVPAN